MTPISYFNDVWRRCSEIESLHGSLSGGQTSAISADELLRAEWVVRVSALDLYVHELVAQKMREIFEGTRPNCPGFAKFQCSTDAVLRIKNALSLADASAAFDLEVRSKIGRITYQMPDEIADGIRMISPIELWNEIAIANGASQRTKSVAAKNLRKALSIIVERRNKIVHEGDLQPSVPRVPWNISRPDVTYVSQFIGNLVARLDALV